VEGAGTACRPGPRPLWVRVCYRRLFTESLGLRATAEADQGAVARRGLIGRREDIGSNMECLLLACRTVCFRADENRRVKCFRSCRLHPLQAPSVSEHGKADGGQSHEEVRFRCSDRHRRYPGHHVRSIPAVATSTADGGWHSRLVDRGKPGGTRLVDHSRSRAHVVIADAAPIP
jgi:hypothetical protein